MPEPYPIISPLIPSKPVPCPDWLNRTHGYPKFRLPIPEVSLASKLSHLQRHFWPALDYYNQRMHDGKWRPQDIEGMLAWYRLCLQYGPDEAEASDDDHHRDAVWRLLLETSPWWNWVEFRDLTHVVKRDEYGKKIKDEHGQYLWEKRSRAEVRSPGMEEKFVKVWKKVANDGEPRRFKKSRLIVTPLTAQMWKDDKDIDWKFLQSGDWE